MPPNIRLFRHSNFQRQMATRNQPKKNSTIYQEKYNSQKELYYETYEVGRALGKGGFAHVYQVQQKGRPEVNAIKMISKLDKQGKQDPVYLQKVRSEIKIMQMACQDSDQMVKYLHSFSDNDYVYIIMELCPLGSLNDMVKRRRTLCEPEVRYFIHQMIHILMALREKKIIHRDIKLANFFIASNYKLKLGDFGLATFYNQQFRNKRGVCGTPNYIAPEVIEKKEYAFEVDLWATGVIMFTMLLGVPPFETKSCKETYDRIKTCSFKFQGIQKNIKISEEAKMLIKDILLRDPKQRITPSQMLNHPFMSYFPIPPALEPECYKSCPSYSFLKKFTTPIVKAEQPESISKPQNNETTLQKMERDKNKQLYRNIKVHSRKTQEVQSCRSPAKMKEQVKVKEQPCIKTEVSRPSKLEASISIKNRENSQREGILPPNKRFKHNFQRINQNSQRDLTATMVKQPLHTSGEYLEVDLTLTDKNLLQIINKKHNILAKHRQVPKYSPKSGIGPNCLKDAAGQCVVWFQISEGNGLLYRLSGGGVGAIFPEGSKMLLSNISTIEYAQKAETRINEDPSATNLCLSNQVEYLNYHYLKLSHGDGTLQSTSGRGSVFVKGYLQLKEATVFSLSSQDLQLILEDGCSLTIKPLTQQLICHHGGNQIISTLPFDPTTTSNDELIEKITKGFFLLQSLGFQVLIEKEWRTSWRMRWAVAERGKLRKEVERAEVIGGRPQRLRAG